MEIIFVVKTINETFFQACFLLWFLFLICVFFFSSLSTQFAPTFCCTCTCFFAPIQTRFERWITWTCTNLSKTKVTFSNPIFTLKTNYDFDRLSKIPKFFLNFSLTQNEHEISALLDLPSSPTSPMDVMDLNPFRYFIGSCL